MSDKQENEEQEVEEEEKEELPKPIGRAAIGAGTVVINDGAGI